MFAFSPPRPRRRMNLTPMIDVFFLLLIFFMLMARFGGEGALPMKSGPGEGSYSGPPRLVEVEPQGLRLNGVALAPRDLMTELVRLSSSGRDTVVLRPGEGTSLQRLVEVMELMRSAGFANLAIAEAQR